MMDLRLGHHLDNLAIGVQGLGHLRILVILLLFLLFVAFLVLQVKLELPAVRTIHVTIL